eukprot:14352089-Alexandrium_andersonii.AAC.1
MQGVFAGTSAVVSEHIVEVFARSNGFACMVGNVPVAFLRVAEDEPVYVAAPVGFRPPAEPVEKCGPKCVWLMKVLYGRRKAAQRWQQFASEILVKRGM